MQYLNILYFLIITFYGYRFLKSDGKIIKSPLNNDLAYHFSGTELFWCLTFATGLLAFKILIGIELMALRLLVLEILCLVGISTAQKTVIISLPLKFYIFYLCWIVIGVFYSPNVVYGVRVILKYLYPILLCLFASAVVTDKEVFFKSSLLARTVAVFSFIIAIIPIEWYVAPGVFWYVTARAINYISIMIFSLGMFFFTNKKKENLFFTILFLFPCFYWVFRTSIMGSFIAIMAFSLIRYKLKSLPVIATIILLGIIAVFTIPSLKEKMFFDDSVTLEDFQEGKIDENNINTHSRSAMWDILEHKFYNENKLTGSGTGAVQAYMYTHKSEFGGLMVPHSDFIQQKCDNGLIALIVYGIAILLIFVDCFRTYWNYSDSALKLCALVAGASIMGIYATFYSDNVVNYSMATLSMPFGFYGMMLGMRRHLDEMH